MIQLDNNGVILSKDDELPKLVGAKKVYLDFETSSGDPKLSSVNPWHHCKICGICITVDDDPTAYYIPWPEQREYRWLHNVLAYAEEWINHNIKYDVHALSNNSDIDVLKFPLKLVDTLTQAKLVNSDKFRYGLKELNKEWLKDDSDYEKELEKYLGRINKDYGNIPVDVLGRYGAQDVLVNRRLHKYCNDHMSPSCKGVWETEQKLTKVLVRVERNGLCVDMEELERIEHGSKLQMLEISRRIAEITGVELSNVIKFHSPNGGKYVVDAWSAPNSDKECTELLVNKLKWPTDKLEKTPTGKWSFNKVNLARLLHDPRVKEKAIVEAIIWYREQGMIHGLYAVPYQDLQVDGVLHPDYNQCVRTGRMSCRTPNTQQISKTAKKLIHPPEGKVFISCDFSQIEFRLIVHYLQNKSIIQEYQNNAEADFHQIVADMCGIDRKPAKNINFACGYGAGKKKVLDMLSSEPSLTSGYDDTIGISYNAFCRKRAESVYERYHDMLPELKAISWQAQLQVKKRAYKAEKPYGWVKNLYGRERHLPIQQAFRAFNTVNQSSAADLMKERFVALAEVLPDDVQMVGNVHDEVLFVAEEKVANDPEVKKLICDTMESPSVELRVPIKTSYGIGLNNWGEIE